VAGSGLVPRVHEKEFLLRHPGTQRDTLLGACQKRIMVICNSRRGGRRPRGHPSLLTLGIWWKNLSMRGSFQMISHNCPVSALAKTHHAAPNSKHYHFPNLGRPHALWSEKSSSGHNHPDRKPWVFTFLFAVTFPSPVASWVKLNLIIDTRETKTEVRSTDSMSRRGLACPRASKRVGKLQRRINPIPDPHPHNSSLRVRSFSFNHCSSTHFQCHPQGLKRHREKFLLR
jgi:hypothetical protein